MTFDFNCCIFVPVFEGTLKDIGFNDQEAPLDVSLNILWGFKNLIL